MWIDFSKYPMFWMACPVVFLGLLGFCRKDGLWGLTIKAFALFFAMMFALNYYQPLANFLDEKCLALAYYNGMWAFFFIFVLVLFLELVITNNISKVNLFFPEDINTYGSYLVLVIIFFAFYFITAPLFFYLIPEAPAHVVIKEGEDAKNQKQLPQFDLLELISSGSLKPVSGGNELNFMQDIYRGELIKNASVYSQVYKAAADAAESFAADNANKSTGWTYTGKTPPNKHKKSAPKPQPKDNNAENPNPDGDQNAAENPPAEEKK